MKITNSQTQCMPLTHQPEPNLEHKTNLSYIFFSKSKILNTTDLTQYNPLSSAPQTVYFSRNLGLLGSTDCKLVSLSTTPDETKISAKLYFNNGYFKNAIIPNTNKLNLIQHIFFLVDHNLKYYLFDTNNKLSLTSTQPKLLGGALFKSNKKDFLAPTERILTKLSSENLKRNTNPSTPTNKKKIDLLCNLDKKNRPSIQSQIDRKVYQKISDTQASQSTKIHPTSPSEFSKAELSTQELTISGLNYKDISNDNHRFFYVAFFKAFSHIFAASTVIASNHLELNSTAVTLGKVLGSVPVKSSEEASKITGKAFGEGAAVFFKNAGESIPIVGIIAKFLGLSIQYVCQNHLNNTLSALSYLFNNEAHASICADKLARHLISNVRFQYDFESFLSKKNDQNVFTKSMIHLNLTTDHESTLTEFNRYAFNLVQSMSDDLAKIKKHKPELFNSLINSSQNILDDDTLIIMMASFVIPNNFDFI